MANKEKFLTLVSEKRAIRWSAWPRARKPEQSLGSPAVLH